MEYRINFKIVTYKMGKTSKNRRRPDNPYAVEGHHMPQGGFVPQGAVTGLNLSLVHYLQSWSVGFRVILPD